MLSTKKRIKQADVTESDGEPFGKSTLKRRFPSADEQDKNESVSEDLGMVSAGALNGDMTLQSMKTEVGCVAVVTWTLES